MICAWIPAYTANGDIIPVTPTTCRIVGVAHLALVDPGRPDRDGSPRRLMASVFYPANGPTERARLVDILEPRVADALAMLSEGASAKDRAKVCGVLPKLTLQAYRDAAISDKLDPYPVVIYYPGGEATRFSNVALCESLASRGYVVFCIDALRDAPVVVFPDGEVALPPMEKGESYITPRVADVRLLIDSFDDFNFPPTLRQAIDTDRIGMCGHSRGGYLSNICAVDDPRIRAAVNMDGFLWGFMRDGTGLGGHPREFQERARALQTPILRIIGEQASREAVHERFLLESADFAGPFTLVSLNGFAHGAFGSTHYLTLKPITAVTNLANLDASCPKTAPCADLLDAFFKSTLGSAAEAIDWPAVDGHIYAREARGASVWSRC